MAIKTFSFDGDEGGFGQLLGEGNDVDISKYDRIHVGFNGIGNIQGLSGRILLFDGVTNDINITRKDYIFGDGHYKSNNWMITMKYTLKQWIDICDASDKYGLTFDIIFRNWGRCENSAWTGIFNFRKGLGKIGEYSIGRDDFIGRNRMIFKTGGLKVIYRDDFIRLKIALLEDGYYILK